MNVTRIALYGLRFRNKFYCMIFYILLHKKTKTGGVILSVLERWMVVLAFDVAFVWFISIFLI